MTSIIEGFDTDGLIGGIRIGADYQPRDTSLVFGVFGNYNFADNDATVGGHTITDEESYLVAGRVGAAFNNNKSLIYGLVGYGVQNVSYGDFDKDFGHIVAGGGFEHKLTKDISVGFEVQRWFAEQKTVFEDAESSVTDERGDTRALVTAIYHFGM